MLSDLILQLLGPKEELNSSIVQLLCSQILSSYIILPLINVFSDPDIINQIVIWLVLKYNARCISTFKMFS